MEQTELAAVLRTALMPRPGNPRTPPDGGTLGSVLPPLLGWNGLPARLALVLLLAVVAASPIRGETTLGPDSGDTSATPAALREQLKQIRAEAKDLEARSTGLIRRLADAEAARAEAERALVAAKRAKARAEDSLAAQSRDLLAVQKDLARCQKKSSSRQKELARPGGLEKGQRDCAAALARLEGAHWASQGRDLPRPQGGPATPDQARDKAAAAGKALLEALRGAGPRPGLEQRQALRAAQSDLFEAESYLGRATGARSLHRVQRNDTLARLGRRFYGDEASSKRIFDANRHLLVDPHQLIPGMTLVVP